MADLTDAYQKATAKGLGKVAATALGIAAGKAYQAFGEASRDIKTQIVSKAKAFERKLDCESNSRDNDLYRKPASSLIKELYCKDNKQGEGPTNNTFTDEDKKNLVTLLNITKREDGRGFKAFTDKQFEDIGKNAKNAIKAATITQGLASSVSDAVINATSIVQSNTEAVRKKMSDALLIDAMSDTESIMLGLGSVYAGAFILKKFTTQLIEQKKNELDNIVANIINITNKINELEVSKKEVTRINDEKYNELIDNAYEVYYVSLLDRAKSEFETPSLDDKPKTYKTVLFYENFKNDRGLTQVVPIQYNNKTKKIVQPKGIELIHLIRLKIMDIHKKPLDQKIIVSITQEQEKLRKKKQELVAQLNDFIKDNSKSKQEEIGVYNEIKGEVRDFTINPDVLQFHGGKKTKSKRSRKSKTRKH